MQQPDDQKDPAHADRLPLHLGGVDHCLGEWAAGELEPVGPRLERRRQQDVGAEDEEVGDIGEHDERLPGTRVGPEHVGGVGLAEAPDEGADEQREADEQRRRHQFENPPIHIPSQGRRNDRDQCSQESKR